MKKFKTSNRKLNIKMVIAVIIFFILFVIISLFRINNVNDKLINILLYRLNNDVNISGNILTANLDYLINNYSFSDNKTYLFNKKVYLYDENSLARELLKAKFNKLGIDSVSTKSPDIAYYILIKPNNKLDVINFKNKNYCQMQFVLEKNNHHYQNNNEIANKLNNYLNNNYPGLSMGIMENNSNDYPNNNQIIIEIPIDENNLSALDNSTEIIALMIYHLIGEK